MLQMRKHCAPQIKNNALTCQTDDTILQIIGRIIHSDHCRKYDNRQRQ